MKANLKNKLVVSTLASMLACTAANAAIITYTGSDATRHATAIFDAQGTDLVVTLINSSQNDVLVPTDVLTGVFFDIGGAALSLTRTSAVVPAGSLVLFGGTDAGGVVGGEWAYLGGLAGAPHGASYGISSSGLGLFGPGNVFPGTNLQGPADPDGLQYGITSDGDNPATGNTPVTGTNALIQDTVVFTLGGLPVGFDPAALIGNVSFQYGTALTEPNVPGTPGPASGVLGAMAVALVARRRR